MKYCVLILSMAVLTGCSVLQNGISYAGEEKIFSKNRNGVATKKREAVGREPGWELGFSFTTAKEARLKGVWIKNPTRGNVPVSVWDAESKQLIQSFQFNVSDTLQFKHFMLQQPLPLVANKKYCITINVTRYYYQPLVFSRLPMQANNCTMISSVYEETYYPRYPQFEITDVVHGLIDIDLDFKQ